MELKRLIEIANDVGMKDAAASLEDAKARLENSNVPLVLPLVGEFSAGKTTLINALTDSKQLETATKPTTATIYQIYFGCDACCATVIGKDGSLTDVDDIAQLKNDELKNASVVCVYDTSKQIPSSTILVDTPGISSPDEEHRRVLMDFLPKSDGVLLTVDVNQQITRSLTDFLKDMALAKRRLYLIITKCDTKSPADVESVKKYIAENCKLPLSQVACVSAASGDVRQMIDMLDNINKEKSSIIAEVTNARVKALADLIERRIDELLNTPNSDDELAEKITAQKHELEKLNRNIDDLIDVTQDNIKNIERNVCGRFNNTVFDKLDALVVEKNVDFDMEARTIANNTASIYLNEYKKSIQESLYQTARERRGNENGIDLRPLEELDYSGLQISEMQYNLNLNELGHQYDAMVSGGAKVLGAAALVAGTFVTAGALAPAAAGAASKAVATSGVQQMVSAGLQTVSKIGGMMSVAPGQVGAAGAITSLVANSADAIAVGVISHCSHRKEIERMKEEQKKIIIANAPKQLLDNIAYMDNYDKQVGAYTGQKKGFVEGVVSKISDNAGKPQRQRAIHCYIEDTLVPCFEYEMQQLSRELMNTIRETLHNEANLTIEQKTQALNELKDALSQSRSLYDERIAALNGYKEELAN